MAPSGIAGLQNDPSRPQLPVEKSRKVALKDEVLDRLAGRVNVAQFVSFSPGRHPEQRLCRIRGLEPNYRFPTVTDGLARLLTGSPEGRVNIRSFDPNGLRSTDFIQNRTSVDEVLREIERLAAQGLYTIVNETIDVDDGGVSGVLEADIIEFAPGDTPRAVDKSGISALPKKAGLNLLKTVYGFAPALGYGRNHRVEFSIHPIRRGVRNEHTVIWELEKVRNRSLPHRLTWPNHFSRLIGDKAFGLLIANQLGVPVPRTTVIGRRVAPFTFGKSTNNGEIWIRSCPREQVPGRYPTHRGWRDPFQLMAIEDPTGEALQAVLAQEGVNSKWSGSLVTAAGGSPIIEGIPGFGDAFMQGHRAPQSVPDQVARTVLVMYHRLSSELGPVRLEWAHDGQHAWTLQLHVGVSESVGLTIYPGEPGEWRRMAVTNKLLETLRRQINAGEFSKSGVIIEGSIGITSHVADLLRRAKIPARIEPK